MNPNFTNTTPQTNESAANVGPPRTVAWLALPNSMSQSRLQLSNMRTLPLITAPPVYVSAPPAYGSAQPAFGSAPQASFNINSPAAGSQTQSAAAGKIGTSSTTENSRSSSSTEQIFIMGPAFSLADSREGGIKRQTVNVPQNTFTDSHQLAPVISNVQTLSSDGCNTHSASETSATNVSSSQICIGSVFSLADSQIENSGQHETENEASRIGIDSSAGRQTTPFIPRVNQLSKPKSADKAHSTGSSQFISKPSSKQSQYSELFSALNSPVHVRSLPGCSNTVLDTNTQSKNSGSVKPVSATALLQTLSASSSPTPSQQSSSAGTGIREAQLPVCHKNDSTTSVTGKKSTDVLRINKTKEKPGLMTKPQDGSSTSQIIPNACKSEEPEVVDLDTEDIDDCMLVKIDLSRHHFPFGSKIHNSEVVIDDSDNEEDVAELPKEKTVVSSGKTSNEASDKQISSASSIVAISESDRYGPTGSLSMEVEEITTEASNINSCGTDTTYTMSSTGKALPEGSSSVWATSATENPEPELMELHVDDDDDDDKNATPVEYVSLKATPSQPDNNTPTPVIQSIYSSSSLLANASVNSTVFNENYQNSLLETTSQSQITASPHNSSAVSSLLANASVNSTVLNENYRNSLLETASPHNSSAVSSLLANASVNSTVLNENYWHSPLETTSQSQITASPYISPAALQHFVQSVWNYQGSLAATSLKAMTAVGVPTPEPRDVQLKNTAEKTTDPNSLPKASRKGSAAKTTLKRKGKAIKSTTPKIKVSALIKAQNKPSSSKCAAPTQQSQTELENSVMCKLCFMPFRSRLDLVTHTWNQHRITPSPEDNLKCEECGKCFANESLLKLHKKIKCTTSNTPIVKRGTMLYSVDAIMGNMRQSVSMGPPQVPTTSTTLWGHTAPVPSTADLSSDYAVATSRNYTHLNVPSPSNIYPRGSEGSSNILTSVAAETETIKLSNVTGDSGKNAVNEELMQEDIKPIITPTGEIQEQSHGPHQTVGGGSPSASNGHKCSSCHMLFSDALQLSLHQHFPGRCKDARHNDVKCFVCAKTFTSNIFRYLHVLNNPECKEKVDRYCDRCSRFFGSPAEKLDHLRMFEPCLVHEEQIMKDPLAKNVSQAVLITKEAENKCSQAANSCKTSVPDKRAKPAQASDSMQTASTSPLSLCCQRCKVLLPTEDSLQQHLQMNPACKTHTEKPKGGGFSKKKSPVKPMPSVMCPACKRKFSSSGVLILHFNESPKCRMKICSPSKVAKKISTSDKTNMPKPVAAPKSPRKMVKSSLIKSRPAAANTSRNVFCDISSSLTSVRCKVCDAKFDSEKELGLHYVEQKICKKLQNVTNLPKLKNLRIVLKRVSVMCKVCHLPFTDNIRLEEHLLLNQPCQIGTLERAEKVLGPKKPHLDSDPCKRDGKKRSCEIGTGISNVTSTISMASTTLTDPMPEADNIIGDKLSTLNDGMVSDYSTAKKKYVSDKENSEDSGKQGADVSDTGELISSVSSSDEGSDVDESASSSEDGGADYTCKQCSKTFTSKSQLKKHNKSHHSGHSKKAQCKVCTRKFHDITGLQAHLLQFKFCFIPLTRPLWERKQDPHSCSMCKKVLSGPKDLRKHCFKKMACRLRYVNMVLKNKKEKENASMVPAAEAEMPASKTATDNCESQSASEVLRHQTVPKNCENQSANEVSSSVQDYCNPVEVDSSNSDVDIEDVTSCIKISQVVSKPLIECLNCSGLFDDFHEHLLKQQSCLDFFGMPGNICPVPLHFCYQCKMHFDDTIHLKLHTCRGFVAYTHACQICGLKFTSTQYLRAHIQQSLTCNKQNNSNSDSTIINSYSTIQQDGTLPSASAGKDVPSASREQSFPCLICDASFVTLRLLMEHSYHHVDETPIACDRCKITFVHYNQFVSHQAFHMRMDKEAKSLQDRSQSKFGNSPSKDKSVRAQRDDTVTNYVSTCIFCNKKFANVKAKLAHLLNDSACLAVLTYVTESKLFALDQESRTADPNVCEFCNMSFRDKMSHYLGSACFGRLEAAILKHRSSPHPAQHKEISSVMNQTQRKDADTRNTQSKPQGEQHSSGEASPSGGPSDSGGKFSEEACCLRCGRCFKSVAEAKKHQTLWGHKQMLPHSVVRSADWQVDNLKCKICNVKYAMRHGLFRHMASNHCNQAGDQFHELVKTSSCSICNKKVTSSHIQLHFENHRKTFLKEIRNNSTQSLKSYSKQTCIFCNREFSSRHYLLAHVKRHTSAVFPLKSQRSSAETDQQFSKPAEKNQTLGSASKSAASPNIVGSCRLCQKQITKHMKYFCNHFRMLHRDLSPKRWREFFVPLADPKQECSPTKTCGNVGNVRNVWHKNRCRLCHKTFTYNKSFVNHLKMQHGDSDPERWEELLEKIEQKTAANVHSVQDTSLKKESSNVKMQGSDLISTVVKSCGKPQVSHIKVSNKTVKLQPQISCKVCSREFSELRCFKIHFKHAHRKYKLGDWEDVFSVLGREFPNSAHTECFDRPLPASETLKFEHTSSYTKSTSDEPADFDTDMQIVRFPSVSKKTATLQPIGSCRLCHKKFTNYTFFKFHMKKSHSMFTPKDQKRLFNAFIPSHSDGNSENSDSDATTSSPDINLMNYTKKATDFSGFRSFKIVLRVCCVCQATFRDVSSYQEHLNTHLKPCKINLQDMHSQLIPGLSGISKDHIDLQVKIEDDDNNIQANSIVIPDDGSEDKCLYPDSTTSENVRPVHTRALNDGSHSQSIATAAECDSGLDFSSQSQVKNRTNDSDSTNPENPQSENGSSVGSESQIDFIIDSSQSGSSVTSHKNKCLARREPDSAEMFSDDQSNEVPNNDRSSLLTGPTFGKFVHTIVESLLGHDHERLGVEPVAMSDDRLSELQLKQLPPIGANMAVKRKAHEAGLGEEQCPESKRSNLTQKILCKDQTTDLQSNSCRINKVHEVDSSQILEPKECEKSCETLQLDYSVAVEEQAIDESPHISRKPCEMRNVEVKNAENQN